LIERANSEENGTKYTKSIKDNRILFLMKEKEKNPKNGIASKVSHTTGVGEGFSRKINRERNKTQPVEK
jgi:hypothetical protein